MNLEQRFYVFFGVWAVLGVASALFAWRAPVEAKRKWFPRTTIGAGILFVIFTYWITRAPQTLVITIPAVALITYLNLKLTKICPHCGATLQNLSWFTRMRYCKKCGAELQPTDSGRP